MKKQKIIWVHSHTLLSTGGTRFIYEVLKRLSEKYTVELIVEKTSPLWKKKFEKLNIKVIEIGKITSTSIFYWALFPFFLLKNYLFLKRIIKKEDIVISSMFPFNFLGSLLSSKHIYYCFEPFAFFYDKSLMKQDGNLKYFFLKMLGVFYSWIDRYGVKKSQVILAINPSVGKYIEKIYKLIPNEFTYLGVDTQHFSPKKTKKKDSVVFFHSTDYTLLKGTQYLISILGYLKKYKNNFKIIISDSVPNSKLKLKFKKNIKKHGLQESIFFVGHVPYEELPNYYSQADYFLFLGNPNSQGASAASLSVLEAQSCGLPVLRSVGNDDEIIEEKTGFYVDPRSKKELAGSIIKLIKNKKISKNLSKNCRKHIVEKYTWGNVAKVFIKSIDSIFIS